GRRARHRSPGARGRRREPPVAAHGRGLRVGLRPRTGRERAKDQMTPHLLITVDTELSNFPDGYGLWGRPSGQDWGLGRMLEVFRELGIRGTFFVDVYAGRPEPLAEQRRAVEAIAAAGQDVQLHTHPGPAFDAERPRLRDYSLDEQKQILTH